MPNATSYKPDWLSRLLTAALQGPLPLLLLLAALAGGIVALMITPREEEPQIIVPMADVLVTAPGLSAEQVERQIATPLEKLLYQIDGVEHVYSMSRSESCVVTVRFYVGEDRVASLVKIYNKLYSETDNIPQAVGAWVVKPIEIDDVPIVVAALWSNNPELTGDHELRRLAEEIEHDLQSIKNTNRRASAADSGGIGSRCPGGTAHRAIGGGLGLRRFQQAAAGR